MIHLALSAWLVAGLVPPAQATPDTTAAKDSTSKLTVRFGGFADVYYAWDSGRPETLDRPYTTQPARHNEFNANLVFLEAVLSGDRVRGRVALQAGTSVQSNYVTEPQVGQVSGGELSRHIQEATVGLRVASRLWIDGGIYFSYIGYEGWISRDNPTYTRSLVADYTPYYLSGAKLTWLASSKLTAQFHMMNGWQNVSESNGDKAVGLRVDWQVTPVLSVGYDTFLGNEEPDSLPARTRFYHQLLARVGPSRGWELSLVADFGTQTVPTGSSQTWYGGTLIARKALSDRVRLSGRVERFFDREQVVIKTGTPNGFETSSASLGLDVQPDARLLWRSEIRGYHSSDPIWPQAGAATGSHDDLVLVTSFAVSF